MNCFKRFSLRQWGKPIGNPEKGLRMTSDEELHRIMSQAGSKLTTYRLAYLKDSYGINSIVVKDKLWDAIVKSLFDKLHQSLSEIFISSFNSHYQFRSGGTLWYVPGSFINWHHNADFPAWRCMIVSAEEPGKSYFKYYDHSKKRIVSLKEKKWQVRLIRITGRPYFWHAVYSDTNRYMIDMCIVKKKSGKGFTGDILSILNKSNRAIKRGLNRYKETLSRAPQLQVV